MQNYWGQFRINNQKYGISILVNGVFFNVAAMKEIGTIPKNVFCLLVNSVFFNVADMKENGTI